MKTLISREAAENVAALIASLDDYFFHEGMVEHANELFEIEGGGSFQKVGSNSYDASVVLV